MKRIKKSMSTRLNWSWLLVLTLGFHAATASAADYFVSPDGDDGAAGKSISAAWRSLSKANAALQPGDTVYLRGGKYVNDPIRPARSGNAAAPIRYVAYEGEIPVLTSGKVRGLDVAIELSGRSHIHIDGIEVDGVKRNPNARVNHFVQIDN